MTECVGLWKLQLDIFRIHNPQPPFRFSLFQIVAFLKEANIPTISMQPFLEELFPTIPTGALDPDPDPDPVTPSRRNEQLYPPKTSNHPERDKWYHTYLYQSNPLPKPHEERERLNGFPGKFMNDCISNLAINKSLGMVQCAHLFYISVSFLLLFHRYGERITLKENASIICAFKLQS